MSLGSAIRGTGKVEGSGVGVRIVGVLCDSRLGSCAEIRPMWQKMWEKAPSPGLRRLSFICKR